MPKRTDGVEGFTVLWTRERCDALPMKGRRPRLNVLFGGHHQSLPSFLRADVRPGDLVFPITVRDRRLLVVGSMEVEAIELTDESDPATASWSDPVAEMLFAASATSSHVDEILRGRRGSPLRLDRHVDAELLKTWVYCSNCGTRQLRNVKGDVIDHHASFDGIYRVDHATRDALHALTTTPLAAVP